MKTSACVLAAAVLAVLAGCGGGAQAPAPKPAAPAADAREPAAGAAAAPVARLAPPAPKPPVRPMLGDLVEHFRQAGISGPRFEEWRRDDQEYVWLATSKGMVTIMWFQDQDRLRSHYLAAEESLGSRKFLHPPFYVKVSSQTPENIDAVKAALDSFRP